LFDTNSTTAMMALVLKWLAAVAKICRSSLSKAAGAKHSSEKNELGSDGHDCCVVKFVFVVCFVVLLNL
jgi:hypothetical protein